jgi:arabinogalactan oligomer/maltooligosaccharide transport system substrate-binding protein
VPAIPKADAVRDPFGEAGADVVAGADPARALAEAGELTTANPRE